MKKDGTMERFAWRRVLGCALLAVAAAISSSSAIGFELASRWSRTATNGSGLTQGTSTTLTWGLVADGVTIEGSQEDEPTSPSNLVSFLDGRFGSVDTWFPLLEQSYNRWGEISGLTFVHEPNNSTAVMFGNGSPSGTLGAVPDMRIGGHSIDGSSGSNILAYNGYPGNGSGGDMVIDTDNGSFYGNTLNNYRALRNTLMHEIGHGIGIAHVESSDSAFLLEPSINTSFDGPQLDDILAAQRHYGDAWEKNGGNDTAAKAFHLGTASSSTQLAVGTAANDTVVSATDIDFVSIDDDSDNDYWSFTIDVPSRVELTLTPRGPTYSEGPQDGTQGLFNTSAQSDLMLRLYNGTGSTLVATANNSGLAGVESLVDMALATAGTYVVRISGSANAAQFYHLGITAVPDFLPGDVNLDGVLATGSGDPSTDDVAAFVAGWKTVLPTDDDLTAWKKGDLNLDRISDLHDAFLLRRALVSASLNASFELVRSVPEPSAVWLAMTLGAALTISARRQAITISRHSR
jgi:serralysin